MVAHLSNPLTLLRDAVDRLVSRRARPPASGLLFGPFD